jgi:hypothetical protein
LLAWGKVEFTVGMDSSDRADDPRGDGEAAVVAALEGNSFSRRDLENAAATGGADIDACLGRLVEHGRVVRIEGEGESVYEMSVLRAG